MVHVHWVAGRSAATCAVWEHYPPLRRQTPSLASLPLWFKPGPAEQEETLTLLVSLNILLRIRILVPHALLEMSSCSPKVFILSVFSCQNELGAVFFHFFSSWLFKFGHARVGASYVVATLETAGALVGRR